MKKIILSLMITLIVIAVPVLAASNYYVDASGGSDSNDGLSPSSAWRTISKVNRSSFNSGDVINFKKGQVWRETLIVPSSGTSAAPIVFNAYGSGSSPIITGADLITDWSQYSSTVWRAACSTHPYVVYLDDALGKKQGGISGLDSKNKWYWNSGFLYVYSGTDPDRAFTSPGIEAGARGYAVNSNGQDYITIKNLHLRQGNVFSGQQDFGCGIYLTGKHWIIQNNIIDRSYYAGILGTTGSGNVLISGNTVTEIGGTGIHTWSGAGSTWTIELNTVHTNGWRDMWASGIITKEENVIIRDNILYDNGNAGDFGYNHGIYIDTATLTNPPEIYGNTIYNNLKGHGIQTKASANIYRNNIFSNRDAGIYIGENGSNNITVNVYYNLLHNNKYGVSQHSKGSGKISLKIYNNLLYHNDDSTERGYPAEINIENNISPTLRNNIIYTTDSTYAVSMVYQTSMNSNYNCFYRAGGGSFIYYAGSSRSWSYWKASYDSYGINANPLLQSPGNGDFLLQAESPCINAGVDVGIKRDYRGTSVPQGYYPEMGAYEYTGANPLTAGLDASPTSGWAPLTVNFDGSASGGTSPYTYSWKFGDGTTSSKQNPEHTFSESGSYTVTLTVTDNVNIQDSDTIIINVSSKGFTLDLSSRTGSPAPGKGGATDPQSGSYSYTSGSDVQVTASPYGDYRFSFWTGGVNSFNKTLSLSMDSNISITANFCTKAGDVNGDLNVSPADAQTVFDIYLGKISNPTRCQKENGDVNCDGTRTNPLLSPSDAQAIFEKYLGINNLPCDCSGTSRTTSSTLGIRNRNLQNINLFIDDFSASEGEKIIVPVIIDNPHNIDSFGFDVVFPAESLEFLGTGRGGLLKDFEQVDGYELRSGTIRIGGYSTIPITSRSSGDLITLIFRVKEEVKESQNILITNGVDDFKNSNTHTGRFFKAGKLNKK